MKLRALVLALSLISTGAFAGDIASPSYKAPAYVSTPCTLTSCSGWYAGMGLSGSGTNANIIGNGIQGSVFSAGGDIDIHGGYQLWNGTYFAAGEVGIGNSFQPNQLVSSLGAKTLTGYEVVKLGGTLGGLFSQPTGTPVAGQAPAAINIPASSASILMSPYFVTGAMQRYGVSQWITGAGAEFLLASHWNLDLRYVYGAPVTSTTPTGSLPPLNLVTVGLNYHF